MASYLIQASYTPEAWAAQVKNPQNRIEALRPVVAQSGGKIVCGYYTFGEYDIMLIVEGMDNVTAAALSVGATAGGAIKSIKTTPLMTVEEGMEAMRKAAAAGYRPPA